MPPKPHAHLTTNGVKRKSRDDSDEEQPAKRTRGSGLAPSHFVPLDGAPEPDASKTRIPSSSTPKSSSNKKSNAMKSKPWSPAKKTPKTRPVLESDREDEEDVDDIHASSGGEMPLPRLNPSKRSNGDSATISKLKTDKKRVPKTEVLSARKPKVVTYKARRKTETSDAHSSSDDDELLLSPSKNANKSTPHSSTSKSALRTTATKPAPSPRKRADSPRATNRLAEVSLSPTKRARFAASTNPSPPPSESDRESLTRPSISSPKNKQKHQISPSKPNVSHSPQKKASSRKLHTDTELDGGSEDDEHALNARSPYKRSTLKNGTTPKSTLFSTSASISKSAGKIKKPDFGTPKSVKKSAIKSKLVIESDHEDEDEEETERLLLVERSDYKAPIKRPIFDGRTTTDGDDDSGDDPDADGSEDPDAEVQRSPSKKILPTGRTPLAAMNGHHNHHHPISPSKKPLNISRPSSPSKLPSTLPSTLSTNPDLISCLETQKRVCLRALTNPRLTPENIEGSDEKEHPAISPLMSLLEGTVERGEGNSCLLLGGRRSGKTLVVNEVLSRLSSPPESTFQQPIIIRLSGYVHTNDRMALREIGRQLLFQNGRDDLEGLKDDAGAEGENGEGDDEENDTEGDDETRALARLNSLLPPPSHMSSLITTMTTLSRPTIIILDAFDLFTTHARQALLYCLLDTVQSCRAGDGRKGVAVVGVTSRMDTLNLLEKRVKSRFSHRIIRCPPPATSLDSFVSTARNALMRSIIPEESENMSISEEVVERWEGMWAKSVEALFESRETKRVIKETFELVRDVGMMNNILISAIIMLTSKSPWLMPSMLVSAASSQRAPDPWSQVRDLPFPPLALLVAAFHAQSTGHQSFTFEHIFDIYSRAARQQSTSINANISLDGVVVGIPKISRAILLGAFEQLIDERIFQPSGGMSASTAFQFIKYRCDVPRVDVKAAIDAKGHTQLKRWLNRPV